MFAHKILTATKIITFKLFMYLCRILPIQKNKIVFSSYRGRQYSDSPMCISKILEKEKDIDIVWIYNSKINNSKIRCVKDESLKAAYELATAKVWVDNCRKKLWVTKRKKQFYVQTWHGNIALKKIEADAQNKLKKTYVRSAKNDSKMIDIILSSSHWATNNFKTAFWYTGSILEFGSPRSDIFYRNNKEIKEKIYNFYKLDKESKIILYAPTFRNSKTIDCYDINYDELIKCAENKWGGKWKVIIRLHPNMTEEQSMLNFSKDILNGLSYQEINDLIVASELLITDYSSCMFDAMEARKKVIFYAKDISKYMDERGTYFNYEDLPFPLATNNKELHEVIKQYNDEQNNNKMTIFMKQQGFCNNGTASEKASELIYNILKTQ